MSGNAEFDQAAKEFETIVKTHNDKISNEEKLDAYGLYKQAMIGDNATAKPTSIFSQEAKAKWEAWSKRKGLSKEDAQTQYISLITQYKEKYP